MPSSYLASSSLDPDSNEPEAQAVVVARKPTRRDSLRSVVSAVSGGVGGGGSSGGMTGGGSSNAIASMPSQGASPRDPASMLSTSYSSSSLLTDASDDTNNGIPPSSLPPTSTPYRHTSSRARSDSPYNDILPASVTDEAVIIPSPDLHMRNRQSSSSSFSFTSNAPLSGRDHRDGSRSTVTASYLSSGSFAEEAISREHAKVSLN